MDPDLLGLFPRISPFPLPVPPQCELVRWDVLADGSHQFQFNVNVGFPSKRGRLLSFNTEVSISGPINVRTLSSFDFLTANLPPQGAQLRTVQIGNDNTAHTLMLFLNGSDTPGNSTPDQSIRLEVVFDQPVAFINRMDGRWTMV
jgi:hypothetical protein